MKGLLTKVCQKTKPVLHLFLRVLLLLSGRIMYLLMEVKAVIDSSEAFLNGLFLVMRMVLICKAGQ